jgi:hypothetical protein
MAAFSRQLMMPWVAASVATSSAAPPASAHRRRFVDLVMPALPSATSSRDACGGSPSASSTACTLRPLMA